MISGVAHLRDSGILDVFHIIDTTGHSRVTQVTQGLPANSELIPHDLDCCKADDPTRKHLVHDTGTQLVCRSRATRSTTPHASPSTAERLGSARTLGADLGERLDHVEVDDSHQTQILKHFFASSLSKRTREEVGKCKPR